MRAILGINAFHGDSAAALIVDGRLVAAAEEERFRRIKHWAGFPSQAIRYCLEAGGVSLENLSSVAVNHSSTANFWRRAAYLVGGRPDPRAIWDRIQRRRRRSTLQDHMDSAFGKGRFRGQVHQVEHHLSHLSSAYYCSRFPEASAVSVDGFGDFASAAWGLGCGSSLSMDNQVHFPHSLGILYQAVTQYLGFIHYGDEYKVMGLAPYGAPTYVPQLLKLVQLQPDGTFRLDLRYFRHARERIEFTWGEGEPHFGPLFSPALADLLGPSRAPEEEITQRHRDLAHSLQAVYETALFHMLRKIHDKHGLEDLVLAGGCAMNSVANGKIYRQTPFRRLYVQAAAGDAGGSIGAAMVVAAHQDLGRTRPAAMDHAYWGPEFTDEVYVQELSRCAPQLRSFNCSVDYIEQEQDLCRLAAKSIAAGRVVGWFQGRMEWGPRALGNRSIVCDPRRADMKEILNKKIKRRESFRPFAPSILRQFVDAWFETDDDVPFMTQVYKIRPEKQALIPAVTHVDGSGRLQTVTREGNSRYFALIEAFREETGVPMVLNTSFNESEPIVCTPAEAIDCFLRTNMDCLFLGNRVIRRSAPDLR